MRNSATFGSPFVDFTHHWEVTTLGSKQMRGTDNSRLPHSVGTQKGPLLLIVHTRHLLGSWTGLVAEWLGKVV
jgi:hypothetical protein